MVRRATDGISPTEVPLGRQCMTDERAFPPWSDNFAIHFFLYGLNLPTYALPLLVAAGYWLLPLLISTWDGTLLCSARAEAAVQHLSTLGLPGTVIDIAKQFAAHQQLQCSNSLPYLQDKTHFLFTLALSLGVLAGVLNLKTFHRTVATLVEDGVTRTTQSSVSRLYRYYRREAFKPKYLIFCAFFGSIAAVLFLQLYLSPQPEYASWWGNQNYGIAGLVFSIIVGGMVFSVLWGSVILVFGSLMLARLMRRPVRLRPFHQDGCNGLAPLGRQIFLLWWVAFFGGVAIYITLQFGYLKVEENPVIWLLAAFGSLAIPTIAIIPLYASLQATRKVQSANLEYLGRFLNDNLSAAYVAVRDGNLAEAHNIVSQMDYVRGLF